MGKMEKNMDNNYSGFYLPGDFQSRMPLTVPSNRPIVV